MTAPGESVPGEKACGGVTVTPAPRDAAHDGWPLADVLAADDVLAAGELDAGVLAALDELDPPELQPTSARTPATPQAARATRDLAGPRCENMRATFPKIS